jgi:hypothetical protein
MATTGPVMAATWQRKIPKEGQKLKIQIKKGLATCPPNLAGFHHIWPTTNPSTKVRKPHHIRPIFQISQVTTVHQV